MAKWLRQWFVAPPFAGSIPVVRLSQFFDSLFIDWYYIKKNFIFIILLEWLDIQVQELELLED